MTSIRTPVVSHPIRRYRESNQIRISIDLTTFLRTLASLVIPGSFLAWTDPILESFRCRSHFFELTTHRHHRYLEFLTSTRSTTNAAQFTIPNWYQRVNCACTELIYERTVLSGGRMLLPSDVYKVIYNSIERTSAPDSLWV